MMDLSESQQRAVRERERDVLIRAGAGSGKTRTLTARFMSLLEEGHAPRALAAITFTEKAAREMRNRIRRAVEDHLRQPDLSAEAREHWLEVEADLDSARIGTIHGLCAAILRAHPAEAAIDPEFSVLDEGQAALLQGDAVRQTLEAASDDIALVPLLAGSSLDRLNEVLHGLLAAPDQADVGFATLSESTIDATLLREVRAYRQAAGVEDTLRTLLTLDGAALQADAGDKLADLIVALRPQVAALQAAVHAEQGLAAACALFNLRRACRVGNVGKKGSRAREALKTLSDQYELLAQPWLGEARKTDQPRSVDEERQTLARMGDLGRLYAQARARYERFKTERRALDFDDLERLAAQVLDRPAVRARWQRQIEAVLVDEFQDTNTRQRTLLERLCSEPADPGAPALRGRLFVVGDGKQSIYRFRGADVNVFLELERTLSARQDLVIDLDQTYRAHAGLVAILNQVLSSHFAAGGAAQVPYADLAAVRPTARLDGPALEVVLGLGEDSASAKAAAAGALAEHLHDLRRSGVAWHEIALLFRASTGFPEYERALEAAGIPFVTVAGRGFYDRPEVRDVLNLLRALADVRDDAAWAGALQSPAFGLRERDLYLLRWGADGQPRGLWEALVGDLSLLAPEAQARALRARDILTGLLAQVDRIPAADLLKTVLDETRYLAVLASHPNGPRLIRNLNKLVADAQISGRVSVRDFLTYLVDLNEAGAREGEAVVDVSGAVSLMTVHKAKGLEYPVVVVADAGRARRAQTAPLLFSPAIGVSAHLGDEPPLIHRLAQRTETAHDQAEDARLLYVAATRAQEKLIVCGHAGARGECWLNDLLQALNLPPDTLAAAPGTWHTVTVAGQVVRARVMDDRGRAGPDGGGEAEDGERETEEGPPSVSRPPSSVSPPPSGIALYRPLPAPRGAWVETEERAVARHLRQADGTHVGVLVHEALRRWCFPADPGFARLMSATARQLGLVRATEVDLHVVRATRLLERLRADAGFVLLAGAERRHEVPFALGPNSGVIDLLVAHPDGGWRVIDFKSDELLGEEAEATLARLVAADYGPQLSRYHAAVTALVGGPVTAELCLLDMKGRVAWRTVVEQGA